jgi:L-asparaginase / beta-aspartyl-peptidase
MFALLACLLFHLPSSAQKKHMLVVHGGAGTITKASMTPEKEKAYRRGLQEALTAGHLILQSGGSALDAVEAAVKILEDNPLFNAGKGAVFTHNGKNELDASIMDGQTLKAGSVAGVTTVKNPLCAARAVMDKSEHVMMTGKGAEQFAALHGCELADASYFFTEERWQSLLKAKKQDSLRRQDTTGKSMLRQPENRDNKYGTVGAVALDINGNLAAATSTGGMTNKRFGRVGDSPIIGAGTYADNKTCAISCTGWGEYFIRLVMAKSVSDRMELAHESLQQAAEHMILEKLPALGGDGGLIGVDHEGNFVMIFNTPGMYRGYINSSGVSEVKIFRD